MSVDKDFVLSALLQHNFLPMQKSDREEMPPTFTSVSFTPDVAIKLIDAGATKQRQNTEYRGYDAVDYKLTRFNGVSRNCSIPHPTAYADLALCIHDNWDRLDYITTNSNSLVYPREHTDGRIIIMNYESFFEGSQRKLRGSFGRRFLVHTDIANFYPSIYSHAVAWATVGFRHTKTHIGRKHKKEWFNQLDERVRRLKRNETQGIAIGPATSNIVSELILTKVDEKLRSDFEFFRFIDDYTAFCDTEEQAQDFVRRLAEEADKYKLLLNIRKTEVIPLPQALADDWVLKLRLMLPKSDDVSGYDALGYLDMAVGLAQATPDGSVLKYALKSLVGQKLKSKARINVLHYTLALAYHNPVLLPILDNLFPTTYLRGLFPYSSELQRIAEENARFHQSDGMAWAIYYMNKYGVNMKREVADKVLESRDCVAMLMLYLSGDPAHQSEVVNFVHSLDSNDLYELDQYWLLLYELFRDGAITNPYEDEGAFDTLKSDGVSFVHSAVVP